MPQQADMMTEGMPKGLLQRSDRDRRARLECSLAVVVLSLTFFAQGCWIIAAKSQTYDESVHIAAGYSHLATGRFHWNAEHPPLTKLIAALPEYLRYGIFYDLCQHRVPFTPWGGVMGRIGL
jgi:hypothetical protein